MSRSARIAVAALAAAVAALVAAMFFGGAATPRVIPGLPDEGPLTRWALPLSKMGMDLCGVLTVGALVTATFLLPGDKGLLGRSALGYLRLASWAALAWAGFAASTMVFTLSQTLGLPVTDVLSGNELTSFASQVSQGIALTLVVLFGVAIALFTRGTITSGASAWLLVLALATLLPPALTGHSASSPNHGMAIIGVALHMVFLALWVGGLAVLCLHALHGRDHLAIAASRFSRMALWCYIGLGVSGLFSVIARLTSVSELFTSRYGLLIVAKIATYAGLGAIGWWHRRRTLPLLDQGQPRAFGRLAGGEVVLMFLTVGLAVGLARTAPPPVTLPVDRAFEMLGYPVPPPISLENIVTLWWFDMFSALVAAALAGLYLAGVVRLRRRGDHWPAGRTVSWLIGVLILVLTTQSGVVRYSTVLFSVHMITHMTLSMLVPIFLVLGAPVTLALRALKPAARRGDRGPREWLTVILHSRVAQVYTHPIVVAVLLIGSTYALYFTPLFASAMQGHLGHIIMTVHFLVSGSLFFWVIIGVDPAPRKLSHVAKLLTLFVTMPFHAFFGIALMMTTTPIAAEFYDQLGRTWGPSQVADQQVGGGIAWAFGEIPTVIVLIALAIQWWRDDSRKARRADRRADAVAARTGGSGDAELDAYNAYLAKLAEHDRARQENAGGDTGR